MEVVIYTEGGGPRGKGHISRCSSLAHALREKGAAVRFVIDDMYQADAEVAEAEYLPWISEGDDNDADITIIDSWIADAARYEQLVSGSYGVFFDDTKRMNYPEGLIISSGHDLEYSNESLGGFEHRLLRPAFWECGMRRYRNQPERILLSFGTSDPNNFTQSVLELLDERMHATKKHVVLGKGNAHDLPESEQCRVHYGLSAEQMKELMVECDIGIISCGQTLLETAVCGLPVIGLVSRPEETVHAKPFIEAGYLLGGDEAGTDKLAKRLEQLTPQAERERRGTTGQRLVDGQGARRVAEEILRRAL